MPPEYEISADPDRIDRAAVYAMLQRDDVYWHRWRSYEIVDRQMDASWRMVGAYAGGTQVGFARALSDGVALAYLADVYVLPEHRGHGLGKRIVQLMIDDGPGRDFRWMLHTRDAQDLYGRFGFGPDSGSYYERAGNPPLAG
jgi:GNAT superfamily N-acetyltransferase